MACKTAFQRRWIVRGGLLVVFVWFLIAAFQLKRHIQLDFDRKTDKRRPSMQSDELTMRSDDPRTTLESDCPENFAASLKECAELRFDSLGRLPKASIILTFHTAETLSSLLHTIHSIIQRTPDQLIEEIIVIDDFSRKDDFGQILEIYVERVFPSRRVSLHRNAANLGLIRSRLKASKLAKGDVLVFMDSHSEVQTGWLEPLLFEIKKNRRSLVNSVVDWMEKTTGNQWTYKYGCSDWTVVFDWTMGFGWNLVPSEERRQSITDAYKSKTIIGTYAAIDKQFFREIGEFDDGMEFWGAENIDLSIRVWLFDGQVLTVPCSRAAHLEGNGTRSYRDGYQSVVKRNYKRLVEVWFDEYKDCFYYYFPELISVDVGDLSDRLKIKHSAPHNFKWYLRNVYPELGCPVTDAFARGRAKNLETAMCLAVEEQNLEATECAENWNDQKMYWSNRFHLRQPNYVMQANSDGDVTKHEYIAFYRNDRASKWIHWKDGPLMELESRLCLEVLQSSAEENGSSEERYVPSVALRPCNFVENARQTWRFDDYTDQFEELVKSDPSTKTDGVMEQQAFLQVYGYHMHG